jgi:hypothetical protein
MTVVKATMTIADSDRAAPFSDSNCNYRMDGSVVGRLG